MNLNKNITDQTGKQSLYKNGFLCLIVFFLIILCGIRVIYVNAEETKEGQEDVQETMAETSYVSAQLQEKMRIRMANEDAIQVAHLTENNASLSPKEYAILTRIVEAEATGLDKKSKILVANVILNRMKSDQFPDTVEEVVFQNVNGAVQFSPVADGRYYSVEITESTKECVDRALSGEDYSQGALYFMERSMSDSSSVKWFDSCLTKLFKYQGHEFYK